MQLLANQIAERLKTGNSCSVFENELARVWRCEDRERRHRDALSKAFAKPDDWSATILDREFE